MLNIISIKSRICFLLSIALFVLVFIKSGQCDTINETKSIVSISEDESKKPGLLILSHGAPMPQWNGPVEAFVDRVQELNATEKIFHAIEGAFLEFTRPDASAGIKTLEEVGCDRIIVVPLFIAPSSHSHFDVPAVLGLYTSPTIRQTLEEEGARIAEPHVPVTITQTLDEGDILDRFCRDEVRKLSKDSANEAIVLLAHGCPDHYRLVDRMVRRVATFCCGQCGIDYADWVYCGMGQAYLEEVLPALTRCSDKKKRILVVGLYVSSSAKSIHESAMKQASAQTRMEFEELLEKTEIVFSESGLVEYEAAAIGVLQTAIDAFNAMTGNTTQHYDSNNE
jgi:protoheme ferro-lyase